LVSEITDDPKLKMFKSTQQNQALNKRKHLCRKVKVSAKSLAVSQMEGKTMEAPALQCHQIYCRGQTKAKDFIVYLAQLFQGFKLSASSGQRIPLCHVNPMYVRNDLPQILVR